MKLILLLSLLFILGSCANTQTRSCGSLSGTDEEACIFHNELVATIPDFSKCWNKYGNEVSGKKYDLKIKLTLSKSGLIQDLAFKEGKNKNINSCVAQVLDSYEFSKPSSNLTVIQPLYFKAQ